MPGRGAGLTALGSPAAAEALADAGVDIENLSDEALEAASEGDIAAALDEIANADIVGVAAAEATKEA